MTRRARRGLLAALACVATVTIVFLLHLNGTISVEALRSIAPGIHLRPPSIPPPLAYDDALPPAPPPAANVDDEIPVLDNKHKDIPSPDTEPIFDAPIPPPHLDDELEPPPFDPSSLPDTPPPAAPPPAPRITFIVLWSPDYRTANYLPNFFASVAANPDIEVLLIKFDKYGFGGDACTRPRAEGFANVREVCLPLEEYHELHLEYMCGVWECTEEQRAQARTVMKKRFEGDRVNSMFRPFRGVVFKQFLHPDLKLWGWCDLDMMLGNVDRTFPFDVADDFDVLLAGAPTGNPKMQIFMPGHMTVFRNAPYVARAFFALEEISSYDNFMTMPWIIRPDSDGCEEGEYSHTLLMRSALTFLRFDAVVESMHHISTLDGVYTIENAGWAVNAAVPDRDLTTAEEAFTFEPMRRQISDALRARNATARRGPTFSDNSQEREVVLRDDPEIAEGWFLWFPRRYAVLYMSGLGAELKDGGRNWRRYTMRRVPNGPVVERFEPEDMVMLDPLAPRGDWIYGDWNRPLLREALYNHYQNEKYAGWWALPDRPLLEGEVLYIDKEHGAHIWDRWGNIMWESPRASSH
ncbi:hypothetical protein K488DRAFT_69605 [Vararia minispora EC-137]|uniref:Uncharacterized protein n=1 Tax=Vararia minispora EC-137 TaxID=1314806 RepID=A0ACB8QPR7_9AGAM|nr:hypothetical protein K488DRAFT_69605 [Vararia minispora EC-137]